MSLKTFLKPLLNQRTKSDDWYVRATLEAMNYYMQELENRLSVPNQNIVGTTVVPGTPPIPTPISGPIGYFIPTYQRFNYSEVKSAMWCGDGTRCFVNLFNLFGKKFADNFTNLRANPVLQINGMVTIPTATFGHCGTELIETARAIGAAMTPDTFVSIESDFLATAISTIPPITVPVTGFGLIPMGTFTGSAVINFSTVAF